MYKRQVFAFITMFILRTQEDVTQIGVGLIKKVQGNRCSSQACFDIIFYAPKGAKSQAGKKQPDTLYSNISVDMAFNLHFRSKREKRLKKKIHFGTGCDARF